MPWLNTKTQTTVSESDIRNVHRNTSFPNPLPQDLSEFGYVWQEPVPVEPEPEKPRRTIRDWEFRNRFTQEQLVGVMRAAMAGDNTAALVWLALSTASDGVDLDKPEHIGGVNYLAATYPGLKIDPKTVLA